MITVLIISLLAFLVFIIPCLIVMFWQKKPVVAFLSALILGFAFCVAPGLIQTFQAMMIYGTGDPQLMAGGISQAITSAILGSIIYVPILFLFQWFGRLRKRKRDRAMIDTAAFE